ncbi:hypothetical protein ACLB0R_15300 [Sphingomonas sp. GlSt437]|uniref:hypothetical protein n=1 Tax=Sphingomonas sp. GlSt437 TaxID=3389970 RepID=UPI003A897D1E
MRFLPFALAGAAALATVATAIEAQRPDDQINAKSVALLQEGKAQLAAGQLEAATDTLETALVADPRNRGAYVALGDVARARGLPGLAYRHYRDALELDPNDLAALRGQGEALVAKGALIKARDNLAKIRKVCRNTACPEATQLANAIAHAAPQAAMATPTVTPKD